MVMSTTNLRRHHAFHSVYQARSAERSLDRAADFAVWNRYCGQVASPASGTWSKWRPWLYPFLTSWPDVCQAEVPAAHWIVDGSPSNAASTAHVICAPSIVNWMGMMIACPPLRSGLRSTRMPGLLVGSSGSVNPERYTRCSITNSQGAAVFFVKS